MEQLFLSIYCFFRNRKLVMWGLFAALLMIFTWGAIRLNIEEDVTKIFPQDERIEKLQFIFQHSKVAERLVVMVSVRDSSLTPVPDSLVSAAHRLIVQVENKLKPYTKSVSSQVDEAKIADIFEVIRHHLPVFLEEKDYAVIDSLTSPDVMPEVLQENFKTLLSPTGMIMKKTIANDPLGLSFVVLKKLQQLQFDDNLELYDGFLITRDHRHLIFFLEPAYPAAETSRNAKLIDGLDVLIEQHNSGHQHVLISYFGGTAVAVGNAKQLQRDTIITVSIMVMLLIIVLFTFFKKKRTPFLILIPVVFGALFSLFVISLIQSSLSVLSLAVGAVILGVAVDYALHYLVILKHTRNVEDVLKDIVKPLTLGSVTTVLAFFALQFTSAAVLRDVGLFAGLSLIGAALCTLVFLPHMVSLSVLPTGDSWVERVTRPSTSVNRWLVYGILILTPIFIYYVQGVSFNSDMNKLNFMTEELTAAQARLENINKASLNSVYLVSSGKDLEEALLKNEETVPQLSELKAKGMVNRVTSVHAFLISDSLQQERIRRWRTYWHEAKLNEFVNSIKSAASTVGFSEKVIARSVAMVTTPVALMSREKKQQIVNAFYSPLVIITPKEAAVLTMINVPSSLKDAVYSKLAHLPTINVDRQMMTKVLVEMVHDDFNLIVSATSILVFVVLLLTYGRIELTLISFIPMLFTWIWILGIMALARIEFNLVNVMVSTFIFGLGDDYSIFVTDGLQQEYHKRSASLLSIRTSIFLSALTTISGLGVLIFAKHPALRSIAAISIIGIGCVFVMSQVIQPFFFHLLITRRTNKGNTPMTFMGMIRTFLTFAFFVSGSLFLTVVGTVLRVIPFQRQKLKLFFHRLICFFTRTLMLSVWSIKKVIIDFDRGSFRTPAIIICNHTSFLDILVTTMLHPKVVLLTNQWVWNSPVFGGVVRLADYYPVAEGAQQSIEPLKKLVEEGYSIVVFPEGKRSPDGRIGRFHKGAFYLAEQLNISIVPLLIHGANESIPKGTMYVNSRQITLKFLPRIEANEKGYGEGYVERTKSISRYVKEEYRLLSLQLETPRFFRSKLISNYVYKGPILEWYMKIKLQLENNYEYFCSLVPASANVLDLGCGYGFLCYMLQMTSAQRTIIGVDYDAEKIATAENGYLKSDKLSFYCQDITTFPLASHDVIFITDVLHYLAPEQQENLIVSCLQALTPGGKLVIRDGDRDQVQRHRGTALTELFSVRLLKFNKSTNTLNFISGSWLVERARGLGFEVEVVDEAKLTSNVIFVISKTAKAHAAV